MREQNIKKTFNFFFLRCRKLNKYRFWSTREQKNIWFGYNLKKKLQSKRSLVLLRQTNQKLPL